MNISMKAIATVLQSLALSLLLVGGAHAATARAPHPAAANKAAVVAAPGKKAHHASARAGKKSPRKVDINSADATTLHASLLNIGQSKAEAIVAWRKQHGAFRSADELAQVKGIGLKTIERNRSWIVVGSVAGAAHR